MATTIEVTDSDRELARNIFDQDWAGMPHSKHVEETAKMVAEHRSRHATPDVAATSVATATSEKPSGEHTRFGARKVVRHTGDVEAMAKSIAESLNATLVATEGEGPKPRHMERSSGMTGEWPDATPTTVQRAYEPEASKKICELSTEVERLRKQVEAARVHLTSIADCEPDSDDGRTSYDWMIHLGGLLLENKTAAQNGLAAMATWEGER